MACALTSLAIFKGITFFKEEQPVEGASKGITAWREIGIVSSS